MICKDFLVTNYGYILKCNCNRVTLIYGNKKPAEAG